MKEEVKVTVQPNQEGTAADDSDAAFPLKSACRRRFTLQRVNQLTISPFPTDQYKQSFVLVHDVGHNWCNVLS